MKSLRDGSAFGSDFLLLKMLLSSAPCLLIASPTKSLFFAASNGKEEALPWGRDFDTGGPSVFIWLLQECAERERLGDVWYRIGPAPVWES